MLPAIRPAISQPTAGSEESADVDGGAADGVTEDDELRDMNKALEAGAGFEGGASISDGILCGPTDGSGPLAQKPMELRGPKTPSQSEIDVHNLTHLPYMDWCPHCVATRRPNVSH